MLQYFIESENEIIVEDELIPQLQSLPIFENCRLDYFDDIICTPADLETIIIKNDMNFYGRVYLYKLLKSPKMIDDNYDKFFHYISLYGVFDAYTKGTNYKIYYL